LLARLDDCVTTGLRLTGIRASVAVHPVAVVADLSGLEKTVSANLDHAGRGASITLDQVGDGQLARPQRPDERATTTCRETLRVATLKPPGAADPALRYGRFWGDDYEARYFNRLDGGLP